MNGSSPGAAMSDLAILRHVFGISCELHRIRPRKISGHEDRSPRRSHHRGRLDVHDRRHTRREFPAPDPLRTIVLLFSMMLVVAYLHLAGFFDWVTELAVTRLKPHHLLPTVIFLSGLLSAFFVNDIICLVMVPFVLKVTRRMGIGPIPYLLAVATASNIGSTATITGNPQNILIGSFSGIGYRDFLLHLGPVALVGLLLDCSCCGAVFPRPGA